MTGKYSPRTDLFSTSLIILLSLFCLTAYAQEQQEPVVNIERQDSSFKVKASVIMPVTPCAAYSLLTDYASLPTFIPGMLEVRYKRIARNIVNVWQLEEVSVLFFHIKMASSLEIEEIPDQRIIFKQTEGDLASYSGEWNLLETQKGTQLTYNSTLTFKHFMPFFIFKTTLEKQLKKQFEAIAKEAISRNDQSLFNCSAGN